MTQGDDKPPRLSGSTCTRASAHRVCSGLAGGQSSADACDDVVCRTGEGDVGRSAITWLQSDQTFGGTTATDDTERDADEVPVLDLHAGFLVAVVEHHLDAGSEQLLIDRLGGPLHGGVAGFAARHHHAVVWRD